MILKNSLLFSYIFTVIASVLLSGNLLAKANEPFGTWMRTQRYNFRDKKLSKERIKKLESIKGWYWDLTQKKWEIRYEELVNFLRKHDSKFPANRSVIGQWLKRQKTNYHKNTLEKQKIELFEKLPNWTWKI